MFRLATSPIVPLLGQHLPARTQARLLNRSYLRAQRRPGRADQVLTTREGDLFQADLSSFQEWNRWVYETLEDQVAQLFASLVEPGARCVVVGAGIGLHVIRLAKLAGPAGEVIAIEPTPELARRATRNIVLNGLANARIIQAPAETTAIDVTCLGPVRLIEADAGEHLAAVVDGAAATIEQDQPAIVFEYAPDLLGGSQRLFGRLAERGYLLYRVRSRLSRLTGRRALRLDPLYARPETGGRLLAVSEGDAPRIISLVAYQDGRV